MIDKRPQGRPCRGGLEVGKAKILEAFRKMLRSEKHSDLSRKAVAAYAGVTPALVSYYFPKKQQLFDEAVTPVVADYAKRICAITESKLPPEEKTGRVIDILIEMHRQDARIVDLYVDAVGDQDHITRMTSAMAELFDPKWSVRTPQEKAACCFETTLLQGAIWGMCRFAAQAEKVSSSCQAPDAQTETLRRQVEQTLAAIVSHAPTLSGSLLLLN